MQLHDQRLVQKCKPMCACGQHSHPVVVGLCSLAGNPKSWGLPETLRTANYIGYRMCPFTDDADHVWRPAYGSTCVMQSQPRTPPLPALAKQWHEVIGALSCDVQLAWPQAHDFAVIAVYEVNAYDGEGVAAELGFATLVGFKQQLYGCSPVMLQGQEVTFRDSSRPVREPSSQLATDPCHIGHQI